MSLQKFAGAALFIAGLVTTLWGVETGEMLTTVAGAAGVLVGYCVQGYSKPAE